MKGSSPSTASNVPRVWNLDVFLRNGALTTTPLVAVELRAPGAPSLVLLMDWAGRREGGSSDLRDGSVVDGFRRDVGGGGGSTGTIGFGLAYESSLLRDRLYSESFGRRRSSPFGRRPEMLPPYPLSRARSSEALGPRELEVLSKPGGRWEVGGGIIVVI
jgi:hypothetical protein